MTLASVLMVLALHPASGAPPGEQTWTIMVYMAADASPELPWELDIGEMEASDLPEEVSVIVLVDPPGGPNSMLLEIANDPNGLDVSIISPTIDDDGAVIPEGGEVNTGSPDTLTEFVVLCMERYPADRNVLVLWGHGAQWHGLCPDGLDMLTLPELDGALGDASQRTGRKLDMIAVDACAEASMEIALQLSGAADLFVGSETNVPSEGLPYVTILGALASATDMSLEEFGTLVVDSYIQWATFAGYDGVDMGVLDLSMCEEVRSRLDRLASECYEYGQLYRDGLTEAATGSELDDEYWTLDVGSLTAGLATLDLPAEIAAAAVDAGLAFQDMVVHSKTYSAFTDAVEGPSGISIYMPDGEILDHGYSDLEIASTSWYEFSLLLRGDPIPLEDIGTPTATYHDSDDDGMQDSLTLTWPDPVPEGAVISATVFSDRTESLLMLGSYESTGSSIEIDGIYGALLISATATAGGNATSHQHMTAVLHGYATMRLDLSGEGLEPGRPLDVLVISSTSSERVQVTSDMAVIRISVPTFAASGEVVEVRVVDRGQDAPLVVAHVAVEGAEIGLSMFLPAFAEEPSVDANSLVLLVLAILPAAAAVAIYVRSRAKKK